MLQFTRTAGGRTDRIAAEIDTLIIAGWTGRDEKAIRHHIEELAAIGVPRPSTVPLFYRVAATQLTQTAHLQALGPDSSGEVEPVVVALADDAEFMRINLQTLRNTAIANFFDLCAISLPIPDAGRLPVGLMLVARHGSDKHLFRIAASVEAALAKRG
jgi:hypothetical protein